MLVLSMTGTLSLKAATPTYNAMVVFGDSLCDVGNDLVLSKGEVPVAPYFKGRFSNGPLWVEHVASSLRLPMKASLSGGNNFAYGGAKVLAPLTSQGLTVPSIEQQVQLYLSLHSGQANPDALFILEGGGNDILDATSGSPTALGEQIAMALSSAELSLRRAGAKFIVIPTLLDVSKIPAGQANATFNHAATLELNSYLSTLLVPEGTLAGVHILRPDWYGLTLSLDTDVTHYGFTNITSACYSTTVCQDPDHTLFWDTYHPSEFGQDLFAVQLQVLLAQPGL